MFSTADWVGPDCDIPCADYQGYFVDMDDGTNITRPIVPKFQCVEDVGGGEFVAWFGYSNPNPNNVRIPLASENAFYFANNIDSTYTPPSKFIPGNVEYAVSVGYEALTFSLLIFLCL